MEYQFIDDPITGVATAKFSLEHEVIGPWLETEVGVDAEKLARVLSAMDEVEKSESSEVTITGNEYSASFSRGEVSISTNASLDGIEVLPEGLIEDNVDFDQLDSASCGSEDFRELLVSWAKFIRKYN